MSKIKKPSKIDMEGLKNIRKNVDVFLSQISKKHDQQNILVLDIAPQIYEGANRIFTKAKVETLDIDPNSDATYIADITQNNHDIIPDNYFDIVICTEVLEHTLNPFLAVEELYRITKKGGWTYISVPFNFRIHGPLPDCWRFTEHGLRTLFSKYDKFILNELATPRRPLMPLHYTLSAKK